MKKVTRNILSITGMLLFLLLAVASGDDKKSSGSTSTGSSNNSTTSSTPEYDIKINAPNLLAEYEENEVAADNKYKGKTILVTGIAESIQKDILDQSFVTLKGDGYFSNIHCTMKNQDDAATIKKGKQYSFIGECTGFIMGSVMIDDCTIY